MKIWRLVFKARLTGESCGGFGAKSGVGRAEQRHEPVCVRGCVLFLRQAVFFCGLGFVSFSFAFFLPRRRLFGGRVIGATVGSGGGAQWRATRIGAVHVRPIARKQRRERAGVPGVGMSNWARNGEFGAHVAHAQRAKRARNRANRKRSEKTKRTRGRNWTWAPRAASAARRAGLPQTASRRARVPPGLASAASNSSVRG